MVCAPAIFSAMMKFSLLFWVACMAGLLVSAQTKVSGFVQDSAGKPLAFSSVMIMGTDKGTVANNKGYFQLLLAEGTYYLVCRQMGYKTAEQQVVVKAEERKPVHFVLAEQQFELNEVVVRNKGEDPAYPIIRKAIKKRPDHLRELKRFECEVYIKGELKLRDFPRKFMGEKVDFEDGDTSKRKILLLSESVAKYSVDGDKKKIEVISTKVSGKSDGFGFSDPKIISFYEENISIGTNLNPRGFVSPIAGNALNYYTYRFMGSFYENGMEISRIGVIPKRKYEPLFTGYINIVENEWRLHSVHLTLLKDQQIQVVDTLTIDQLFVPRNKTWAIRQQSIYPSGKMFGFDFYGNFLQVYNKFVTEPSRGKKFFDNTVLVFKEGSNKKNKEYWDTARPIPLSAEEQADYKRKDSLEIARSAPRYLDSVDRAHNKVNALKLFVTGWEYEKKKRKITARLKPLINSLYDINTVEGWGLGLDLRILKQLQGRNRLVISPSIRYGSTNHRLNASLGLAYRYGKKYVNEISVEGGQQMFQVNNQGPISPFSNALSTLFYVRNYLKLYQAPFVKLAFEKSLGHGLEAKVGMEFQDRLPLENTNTYRLRNVEGHAFTPNYPEEIATAGFQRHGALSFSAGISFSPGKKYIEFPDRKIAIGSRSPVFQLSFTKGTLGLLGSDVDYAKWNASVTGQQNLKLAGKLSFRSDVGGFLKADRVFTPDYIHFRGNQTAVAQKYLEGFQLLSYYSLSNTADVYGTGNLEYHLNGFLSNKIPGVKKLNWFFVLGGNALLVKPDVRYYECFFSVENIFRAARVDLVQAFPQNADPSSGVRFSLPIMLRSERERR